MIRRLHVSMLPGLLVGMTFGLGKIVRDCALTCNVGYELSPLAILSVAIATFAVSAAHVRLESRLGFRRFQILSLVAAALSAFALRGVAWLAVISDDPAAVRAAYILFYV